jgi:hypothetical protein
MDWNRLLARFGEHWPVLLSHLILFGYIYPEERAKIPPRLLRSLLHRYEVGALQTPTAGQDGADGPVCHGPVLSRTQYVVDVEQWGYQDARVEPLGKMTADEATAWTEAGLEQAKTSLGS